MSDGGGAAFVAPEITVLAGAVAGFSEVLVQPALKDKPAISARIDVAPIGVNRGLRGLNCFIMLMRWRIGPAALLVWTRRGLNVDLDRVVLLTAEYFDLVHSHIFAGIAE